MRLGWRSPFRVQGLRVVHPEAAAPLMEVGKLSCDAGLWEMAVAAGEQGERVSLAVEAGSKRAHLPHPHTLCATHTSFTFPHSKGASGGASAASDVDRCLPLLVEGAGMSTEIDPATKEPRLTQAGGRRGRMAQLEGVMKRGGGGGGTGSGMGRRKEQGGGLSGAVEATEP